MQHYADEYKLEPRGQLEASIVATLSQCVRQQISFIRQQEETKYQTELKSLEGKSISSIRYSYSDTLKSLRERHTDSVSNMLNSLVFAGSNL